MHLVYAKTTIVVLLYLVATIPIYLLLAIVTTTTQDFLFKPKELNYTLLFSYIINSSTKSILVKNSTPTPIKIPWNAWLGHLQELGVEQGLLALAFLAIEGSLATLVKHLLQQKQTSWFTKIIDILVIVYSLQALVLN